ncbi:MAG: hypothetical protein J6H21_00255 [Firmicutes bacterium]|nr:hypothetical protein [Bacillota bacterium]
MVDNRIKIFGASDCYGLSDDLSFTIRAEYIMRDEVDYISLRKAVDMLEERFGFLKVSLKKNMREFYYIPNPRPWVVKNTDMPIPLNCEESNDQLIAFSYNGKSIYTDVYHGQMDGTGIYRLTKALLYNYCCVRYQRSLDVPDVAKPDDVDTEDEATDVYYDFYNKMRETGIPDSVSKAILQKPCKAPMQLDRMGLVHMDMDKRTTIKFTIPQADLIQYCSSYDGSPVTVLALILSEAIYSIHNDSSQMIQISIPVNLRPALGVKNTIASTYSNIMIQYDEKIRKKDLEMQGTLCRGIVIRYSDADVIKKQTFEYCSKLALLQKVPLRFIKQVAARHIAKTMKTGQTASTTYTGRSLFGEMEEYVDSMYFDVDSFGMGVNMVVASFKDTFYISIDQDWDEGVYKDAIFDVLVKRGIRYNVHYEGPLRTAVMKNI